MEADGAWLDPSSVYGWQSAGDISASPTIRWGEPRPPLLSNNALGDDLWARGIRSDITCLKQDFKRKHVAF